MQGLEVLSVRSFSVVAFYAMVPERSEVAERSDAADCGRVLCDPDGGGGGGGLLSRWQFGQCATFHFHPVSFRQVPMCWRKEERGTLR